MGVVVSPEELKERIDIVEVVGHYLPLKRVGSSYRALCPFHAEKTPSFYVSPSKQIYHCFGCGAGGDAIKFVMEYEKVDYWEALEKIASLYNLELKLPQKGRWEFSSPILEEVARYYQTLLHHPLPPEVGHPTPLHYLLGRGLKPEIIEKFQLGYAPEAEIQLKSFRERGFNFRELERLGVLVPGRRGPFPRLIERVTFPIHSPRGKVIAFGGRSLTNHPAKYLNFSNTPIFNKSRTFYGFHLARDRIVRQRRAIIVEGYLDVIALHQAGFTEAIATLGTALTPSHLPQLSRLECKVILAYDGDPAGRSSALKGAQLLYRQGFEGGVVLFEGGKDPADLVKEGRDLTPYFQDPIPFERFIVEELLSKYNLDIGSHRQKAYRELISFIESVEPVLRDPLYLQLKRYFPTNSFYISPSPPPAPPPISKIDRGEGSILKTALHNPELLEWLVEVLPPEAFTFHREEAEALYYSRPSEKLKLLEMEGSLPILSEKSFKRQVRGLLLNYYQKLLKQLPSSLSPAERGERLRELVHKIRELKKGEWV